VQDESQLGLTSPAPPR